MNSPGSTRSGLSSAISVYLQPRLLFVFVMGFASGLPLALSSATLFFWLAEAGVAPAAIGLFALPGLLLLLWMTRNLPISMQLYETELATPQTNGGEP